MGRAEILQAKKHYIKLMDDFFFLIFFLVSYQKYTEFELEWDGMGLLLRWDYGHSGWSWLVPAESGNPLRLSLFCVPLPCIAPGITHLTQKRRSVMPSGMTQP